MNVSASLPAGVHLVENGLLDELRGAVVSLNPVGKFVVGAVQTHPVSEVSAALAGRFGIDTAQAQGHVERLLLDLNRSLLLNIRRNRPSVHLMLKAVLVDLSALVAGAGMRQPVRLKTRRRLRTSRVASAVVDTLKGLTTFLAVAAFLTSLVLALGVATGATGLATSVAIVLLVAAVGVAVHEIGHVIALRGEPAALVTAWLYAGVHHARLPSRRSRLVAAAGPAVTAIFGLAVVGLGAAFSSVALAVAGLSWAAHVVGLTNLAHDGRNLIEP